MAKDTQSFTEIFSNENSTGSSYWSDFPETPKIEEKKTIIHQNPSAMHVMQIFKKWVFYFQKWMDFKSIWAQF